jgi:MoaA/NifB/PqqE/SkfB family radical SAM enzyme
MKSKTFCIYPFTGMVTREDGALKPCCRAEPIGWINNESLEKAWNNENMQELRRKVLNGERPVECTSCWKLESQGVESLRQTGLKTQELRNKTKNCNTVMPYEFPVLEIKLNNLCNLKCRMCNPLDSTQWKDWNEISSYYKKENNYLYDTIKTLNLDNGSYIGLFDDNPNWLTSFKKIMPYLRIVEFGGGEPLMDPQHYEILDMLSEYGDNIEIRYATNGTTLGIKGDRNIQKYWPKFKNVIVNVSIDGIHDVYEHVRSNGKFQDVKDNIEIMKTLPNITRIVGKHTAQAGNILHIADTAEYFIDTMGIPFFSHKVSYPNVLSIQVLPKELKLLAQDRVESFINRFDKLKNQKLYGIDLKEIVIPNLKETVKFMNAKDCSYAFDDFINFNKKLDSTRNSKSIFDVNPEFKQYG